MLKKHVREEVHKKFDGHCSYCGKEITIKETQVDHLYPQKLGGTDDFDNLMPSCRRCNHYKRANTLSKFRNWLLAGMVERLKKDYRIKVALDYNMITFNEWDKTFYYERKNK